LGQSFASDLTLVAVVKAFPFLPGCHQASFSPLR